MRILVTRAGPQGEATARRLEALGHQAILLPLAEIRAVAAKMPAGHFDAAAATSANGLMHASADLRQALGGLPLFAVGAKTAAAAQAAGFGDVREGGGDAKALSAKIAAALAPGARVIWLCGRLRSVEFARSLAACGISAVPLVTYETIELGVTADIEADAALIHSPQSAARLARAVSEPTLQRMRLVCISRAAADALPPVLAQAAVIAGAPNESAMLAALEPG